MDYRRYARQDVSGDLPQRKSANNDRFNPSDKYSGISGYDPIYNATECDLNRGRIIGIDTSERWDPFHHPFYFDADSNLVYGGSRDLRDSPFEQAVRRAYEECLKRHHGKKPAPTLKKHYIGDSGQQAPPGKMLNSKAAGRLLAAGGVYNGNVAGFRKTAEQLGGHAVMGYDQVLNEKTSGSMIAAAAVLFAKTARNPLTRGELSSSLVENNSLSGDKARKAGILIPGKKIPNIETVIVSDSVAFSAKQLDTKFKHASDFGVVTTKKNGDTIIEYQTAIKLHLDNTKTYEHGTYLLVPGSKVFFNPKTNNVVVVDKTGNFVSGWKLAPQTKQYENFMNNGTLR
ncbi:colicin D domain-containing protein [Erwinia rhapontici]|uniref:colicin D domain-containing protein n=1 Tax=Erwinia rhapontici TaxID=55212 RepID=UPI003D36F4B5